MKIQICLVFLTIPSVIGAMQDPNNKSRDMQRQYNNTQVVLDVDMPSINKSLITSSGSLFGDEELNEAHPFDVYKLEFLRKVPYFVGKKDIKIAEDMTYIQGNSPVQFGHINQLLLLQYEKTKTKSIEGVEQKDLQTVNDKILFALVETLKADQESGGENRKADLAQAARDRNWTRLLGGLNFLATIPATVTAAVALYHVYHPIAATVAPAATKFFGY